MSLQLAELLEGQSCLFQYSVEDEGIQLSRVKMSRREATIRVRKVTMPAPTCVLNEPRSSQFPRNFSGTRWQVTLPQALTPLRSQQAAHELQLSQKLRRADRNRLESGSWLARGRSHRSARFAHARTATRAHPRGRAWSSQTPRPACGLASERRAALEPRQATLWDRSGLETARRCTFAFFYFSTEVRR